MVDFEESHVICILSGHQIFLSNLFNLHGFHDSLRRFRCNPTVISVIRNPVKIRIITEIGFNIRGRHINWLRKLYFMSFLRNNNLGLRIGWFFNTLLLKLSMVLGRQCVPVPDNPCYNFWFSHFRELMLVFIVSLTGKFPIYLVHINLPQNVSKNESDPNPISNEIYKRSQNDVINNLVSQKDPWFVWFHIDFLCFSAPIKYSLSVIPFQVADVRLTPSVGEIKWKALSFIHFFL